MSDGGADDAVLRLFAQMQVPAAEYARTGGGAGWAAEAALAGAAMALPSAVPATALSHGPHPHDAACPWSAFDWRIVSPTLHAFGIDDPTLSFLSDSSLACLYGAPCPLPQPASDVCLAAAGTDADAGAALAAVAVAACAAEPTPHVHGARAACPILPRGASVAVAARSNYEKIAALVDKGCEGDGATHTAATPAAEVKCDEACDAPCACSPGEEDDMDDELAFADELVDSVRARRSMHTTTERARRASLKAGFADLQSVVPRAPRADGRGAGKGRGVRASKATLLADAAVHIRTLQAQLDASEARARALGAENEELRHALARMTGGIIKHVQAAHCVGDDERKPFA